MAEFHVSADEQAGIPGCIAVRRSDENSEPISGMISPKIHARSLAVFGQKRADTAQDGADSIHEIEFSNVWREKENSGLDCPLRFEN
jgi:hypothetical protein